MLYNFSHPTPHPLPLYGYQFPFIYISKQSIYSLYIHPSVNIHTYINLHITHNKCINEELIQDTPAEG